MGSISTISGLLRALRRQAWLIALLLALGLPFAYWFAITRPSLYEAVAVLGIEKPAGDLTGLDINRQLDEIQSALLSRENIAQHIERLALFPEVDSQDLKTGLVRGAISITRLLDPAQAWRPDAQPYGLSIVVRLPDPEQAAALANALLNSIVTEGARRATLRSSEMLDQTAEMLEYLQREEERVQESIRLLEEEIAEFREANLASLPDGLTAQRGQLANLIADRVALDREIIAFGGTQGQVRAEVFERQKALLEEQREMLTDAISEIETALAAAPGVERQLSMLTRRLEGFEAELEVIVAQRAEAAMSRYAASRAAAEHLSILEPAVPPEFAVSTSRKKIAIVAAAAVGALAIAVGLARELLNPAVRTAEQLHREIGITPVAVIPTVVSRTDRRRRRNYAALFVAVSILAAGIAGIANT